jgi:hypothetical protein
MIHWDLWKIRVVIVTLFAAVFAPWWFYAATASGLVALQRQGMIEGVVLHADKVCKWAGKSRQHRVCTFQGEIVIPAQPSAAKQVEHIVPFTTGGCSNWPSGKDDFAEIKSGWPLTVHANISARRAEPPVCVAHALQQRWGGGVMLGGLILLAGFCAVGAAHANDLKRIVEADRREELFAGLARRDRVY